MAIIEIDEFLRAEIKRDESRRKSRKRVVDAMQDTIHAVYEAFEVNAEFRQHLLKAFDKRGRVFEEDDGAKLIVKRMLQIDLPEAIGECAPYDRDYDKDPLRRNEKLGRVSDFVRSKLQQNVLQLRARNFVDWTRLNADKECQSSEVLRALGNESLTSYVTYFLGEKGTGQLTLLTPYFNSCFRTNAEPNQGGGRINALLGFSIHEVMNRRVLGREIEKPIKSLRSIRLPSRIPFTYEDSWAGRYAKFDLNIGNLEALSKQTAGNQEDDGRFGEGCLKGSYLFLRKAVNEHVSRNLAFAGLSHQMQVLPKEYMDFVVAQLKDRSL